MAAALLHACNSGCTSQQWPLVRTCSSSALSLPGAPPQVREQLLNQAERQRLETVQAYVNSTNGAPFPAPPPVPEDKGPSLNDWTTHSDDVITV